MKHSWVSLQRMSLGWLCAVIWWAFHVFSTFGEQNWTEHINRRRSSDRHTYRLKRVDACDAGNRWWRNGDESSTPLHYEHDFDLSIAVDCQVVFGSPTVQVVYFSWTRLVSWHGNNSIICILMHWVPKDYWPQVRCCDGVCSWSNGRTLNDACHDVLNIADFITEFCAVKMMLEDVLNLVIDVIWYFELWELVKDEFLSDGMEYLGEIHCIDDDVRVGV
jgi:hypothetical protein